MKKRLPGIIISITVSVIIFAVQVFLFPSLREKKGILYDFFLRISRKEREGSNVIIVEEDIKTHTVLPDFERLREYYYMGCIDSLKKAKVITVNEIFWGHTGDSMKENSFFINDSILKNLKKTEIDKKIWKKWVKILKKNNNVILAVHLTNKGKGGHLIFGESEDKFPVKFISFKNYYTYPESLLLSARDLGIRNLFPDHDGKIRGVPLFFSYNGNVYPSLTIKTVMEFLELSSYRFIGRSKMRIGKGRTIPLFLDKKLLLSFSKRKIPVYSMADIFDTTSMLYRSLEDVEGKIILIGKNEKKFLSPTGEMMGDLDIMAEGISDILSKSFIKFSSEREVLIILILFSFLFSFIIIYFRWKALTSFLRLGSAIYFLMIYMNIRRGIWIKPYITIISLSFAVLVSFIWKYLYELKPRRKFKDIMKHYISSEEFSRLTAEGILFPYITELKMGTVVNMKFYPDMENWLENSGNVNYTIYNELFTHITEILLQQGGKIVGVHGYSITLLFPHEDGPSLAVRFINKFRKSFSIISGRWQSEGWGKWNVSIGVRTGNVTLATSGKYPHAFFHITNPRAFEAHFLERLNVDFEKYTVFMDEETHEYVKDMIISEEIGTLEIEGEEIKVYEMKKMKEESVQSLPSGI